MKKKIIMIVFIFIIFYGIFCSYKNINKKNNHNYTKIIEENVDLENDDEKINWDSFKLKEITLNKSININESGIYKLSGSIKNGNITINTRGNVKLIFNNISIKNNNGPAINIENSNNVVIEINGNNKLEDGSSYSNKELDGCIYSKDDLIFQGHGSLEIVANYLDGIVSTNDIKFVSGTYNIKSNGDGIRGKDSIYIKDGNFNIECINDGIKSSTNDNYKKGFIYIKNGTFNINSKEDGIQTVTKLIINNGKFNITTGNDVFLSNSNKKNNIDNKSSKGLKSNNEIIIKNGIININSKEDAIHSNDYIKIVSGNITISSGDDGIHADKKVIIDNGNIKINDSYEGIESKNITMNGGNVSIISNDDGINIVNSNSKSNNNETNQSVIIGDGGTLNITGGKLNIDSSGDGIDSNGKIIISGGEVFVNGPTENLDIVTFDYDVSFEIFGGKVFGVSLSPVSINASRSTTQNTIVVKLKKAYNGNIKILDKKNNVIINYSPNKKYDTITISDKLLKLGEEYFIEINGKIVTNININSNVNYYDNYNYN